MASNIIKWDFWNNRIKKQWNTWNQNIQSNTWATVQSLLTVSEIPWVRHIFSRLDRKNNIYKEFFENLFRIRSITIFSDEPDITLASILSIEDPETWAEWEIGLDSFVRLLDMPPGAIHDDQLSWYIMSLLNVANIDIGLHVNDEWDNNPQKITPLSELEQFIPEKTLSAIWDGKKMIDDYDIALNLADPENGAYTSADRFRDPHELPLLYMMIELAQEAYKNGYSPLSETSVEISQYQKNDEATTSMTFAEMCWEIDRAIIRKWPHYANYRDPAIVRNIVYDKYIVPRILPLELQEDE